MPAQGRLRGGEWLALAALLVLLYTWVLLPHAWLADSLVSAVGREDGIVESLGALSLLVASVLFGLSFLRARRAGEGRLKQLFLAVLAAALLIGAGEEVSWGQRAFDYRVPESVKEINNQEEATLHNLSVVAPDPNGQPYVWHAFELFTLLFVVVVPLAALRSPAVRARLSRHLPVTSLGLAGIFLLVELMIVLCALLYAELWEFPGVTVPSDVLQIGPRPWQAGSTTETALSLLWVAVAVEVYRGIAVSRTSRPDQAAAG